MGTTETRQLLRVSEVARQLATSRSSVYRWIHDGTIPAVTIGNTYRVDASELAEVVYGESEQG